MGSSMPKFITNGYTSVKETYYSFKSSCNEIKESFKMVKSVINMARKLSSANSTDPADIVNALKSADGLPDEYRDLFNRFPPETLSKITKLVFEVFNKQSTQGGRVKDDEEDGEHVTSSQDPPQDQFDSPKLEINTDGLSQAIKRMTDAMLTRRNTESQLSPPPSHDSDIYDTDPPRISSYTEEEIELVQETSDEGSTVGSSHQETNSNNIFSDDFMEEKYNKSEEFERNSSREPVQTQSDTYERRNYSERANGRAIPRSKEDMDYDIQNDPKMYFDENQNTNPKRKPKYDQGFFKKSKPTGSGFDDYNIQEDSAGPKPQDGKEIPPTTKMLGDELLKRFGPDWRKRVPSFIQHPEMEKNVPDLGLGLSKEGNRDMVIQMSRVLKDLM